MALSEKTMDKIVGVTVWGSIIGTFICVIAIIFLVATKPDLTAQCSLKGGILLENSRITGKIVMHDQVCVRADAIIPLD